jgi:hypothetical protein
MKSIAKLALAGFCESMPVAAGTVLDRGIVDRFTSCLKKRSGF